MDFLIVACGLGLAIFGAQLLVKGGVAIAQKFNISTLIIGIIVVGFGSSTPELTVNISSALNGKTDLALGNILGSNLFNICVIVGIVSLMSPLLVNKQSAEKDLPMSFISALMVGVCGNELYIDHINYHELMPSHGIIFLCFFSIFMYYTIRSATGSSEVEATEPSAEDTATSNLSLPKAVIFIAIGLMGLVYGGDLIVKGAEAVAKSLGISERVIGLMIVGPGTSFPELIASIVAALNKNADMVIGNVLGSNIFNIFLILGLTTFIQPVPLDLSLNYVVVINIAVVLFLSLAVWLNPRRMVNRVIGILLLIIYLAYIVHSLGV